MVLPGPKTITNFKDYKIFIYVHIVILYVPISVGLIDPAAVKY